MKQLHDIDLRLLRIFETVLRCGGFSAAQAELNIGQSTISSQIGQLEIRLGARLCERGRGGFRLTPQGVTVHEAAQRLLSAIDNFRIETDLLNKTMAGTLNLGVIDNTVSDKNSPLGDAVQRFSSRGHDIHINIYIGMPSELEQRVLDGRLHVAIGHFPFSVPGLDSVPLYEEVEGLFCGSSHPLVQPGLSKRALMEQLQTSRVVTRGYLRRQDLDLLHVNTATSTTDNIEAQIILILWNACVGFLPLHYAAAWLNAGELKQLMPDRMILRGQFSAITRRVPLTPLVRSFLADLNEACRPAHVDKRHRNERASPHSR